MVELDAALVAVLAQGPAELVRVHGRPREVGEDGEREEVADAARWHRRSIQDRIVRVNYYVWQTGHQYVVRPPIVARSSGAPSRGHVPARPRACTKRPVWTPPSRIASRVAARSWRRRRSSSSVRQLARDPARGEAGAPERLVGEQVADAGDRALIEQPGLEGDRPPADARAEHVPAHLGRVGPDVGEVGLDHGPPEPALVAQREPAAVGEVEHEPVPVVRGGLLVDRDPPRHPEVQPEVRAAVVRLRPQELPAPVRRGQPPADQRRRDLARRVRAADVGVACRRRRRSRGRARARSAGARARPPGAQAPRARAPPS